MGRELRGSFRGVCNKVGRWQVPRSWPLPCHPPSPLYPIQSLEEVGPPRHFISSMNYPQVAQLVRIRQQCRRPWFDSWVRKFPWKMDRLPLQYFGASLEAQVVKNWPAMLETWVWSLGWEDPGGGHGNPFQYSCLENSHGHRSLADCGSWDGKDLDMTERLSTAQQWTIPWSSYPACYFLPPVQQGSGSDVEVSSSNQDWGCKEQRAFFNWGLRNYNSGDTHPGKI